MPTDLGTETAVIYFANARSPLFAATEEPTNVATLAEEFNTIFAHFRRPEDTTYDLDVAFSAMFGWATGKKDHINGIAPESQQHVQELFTEYKDLLDDISNMISFTDYDELREFRSRFSQTLSQDFYTINCTDQPYSARYKNAVFFVELAHAIKDINPTVGKHLVDIVGGAQAQTAVLLALKKIYPGQIRLPDVANTEEHRMWDIVGGTDAAIATDNMIYLLGIESTKYRSAGEINDRFIIHQTDAPSPEARDANIFVQQHLIKKHNLQQQTPYIYLTIQVPTDHLFIGPIGNIVDIAVATKFQREIQSYSHVNTARRS